MRQWTVFPDRRRIHYWQKTGWRRVGAAYHGFYRTYYGAWRGKATVSPSGRVDFLIHNPPPALRHHSHSACFRSRPGGWVFVHFTRACDISTGIIRIEQILREAHER